MVHNEWYQKFTSRSLDFAEEKNTGFVGIFLCFYHHIPFHSLSLKSAWLDNTRVK